MKGGSLWDHLAVCMSSPNNISAFIFVAAGMFLPSRCLVALVWLHYSSFQASCHIAFKSYWTLCFLCGCVVLHTEHVVKGKYAIQTSTF
jgi:hypothetical protein